ncbi:hypothetical protein BC831DRAFT_100191 [Entophlyctis helioformis]|nr:hypothetical protein BC831DRAFT_100191 [Entophlyctis helioformis]
MLFPIQRAGQVIETGHVRRAGLITLLDVGVAGLETLEPLAGGTTENRSEDGFHNDDVGAAVQTSKDLQAGKKIACRVQVALTAFKGRERELATSLAAAILGDEIGKRQLVDSLHGDLSKGMGGGGDDDGRGRWLLGSGGGSSSSYGGGSRNWMSGGGGDSGSGDGLGRFLDSVRGGGGNSGGGGDSRSG